MWWQQRFNEFVALFLVINPFGALPTFLELAAPLDARGQRRLAFDAAVIAFVVLVFFLFAGAFLLEHMGVSIRAFQIAGGIVLFMVALEMIRGDHAAVVPTDGQGSLALAVYPLAIPKIAGPGAMLAAVLVGDDDRFSLVGQLSTVGILALVLLITFLLLLAAGPIARRIGTAGASIISRIMGMLLAALAVALVLGTVADWLGLPRL
jgi:multiple antibiotic resistance protein